MYLVAAIIAKVSFLFADFGQLAILSSKLNLSDGLFDSEEKIMTMHRYFYFFLFITLDILLFTAIISFSEIFNNHGERLIRHHVVTRKGSKGIDVHLILARGTDSGDGPFEMDHYVEHLVWLKNFGGTAHATDHHSNAWTTKFAVSYRIIEAKEELADIFRSISRVFNLIDLPRSFAEEERDIILREYDLHLTNNPDGQAGEAMDSFLYEGNAVAASVIGTPEQIRALNYDTARVLHVATK